MTDLEALAHKLRECHARGSQLVIAWTQVTRIHDDLDTVRFLVARLPPDKGGPGDQLKALLGEHKVGA